MLSELITGRRNWPGAWAASAAAAALVLSSGCTGQIRNTTTARGSTETLLLSTSAERAIRGLDATGWRGKSAWLDLALLDCVDKNYAVSTLRVRLARAGVTLVEARDQADLVIEPRAGTLATWEGNYGFGIPPLPISYGGSAILTPDLKIGFDVQQGWTKLNLFAYDRATGAFAGEAVCWGMASEDLIRTVYPSILESAKEMVAEAQGEGAQDLEQREQEQMQREVDQQRREREQRQQEQREQEQQQREQQEQEQR